MKNRWVKGPTKHPVINAYEKPGLLFELEDLPDEWRLWATQISDKPEEARKQIAAYLADQKQRREKLKEQLKSTPEVLLNASGVPPSQAKAAAAAAAATGKPGAKPAAGGKPAPAPAGGAKPPPAKK